MAYGWKFSLKVERIPQNRFDSVLDSIVEFVKIYDVDVSNILANKEMGSIQIFDCEIRACGDFNSFAAKSFQEMICGQGYIHYAFEVEHFLSDFEKKFLKDLALQKVGLVS